MDLRGADISALLQTPADLSGVNIRELTSTNVQSSTRSRLCRKMSQTARVKNPTHSELRLHSTCFKGMCPSMFRSPEDAYATFQQVKVILNNKGVDFMAPCGKQNLHDCDLFKHIGVCNDVLAAIQVHIDELVETREVAVCFSATTSDQEEPREDVQRAVVLLHRLLVKHICVATIVLDDLGRFCNQGLFSILCNGISKCRGLKSLRVNAVNDEASYYRQLLTGADDHAESALCGTCNESLVQDNVSLLCMLNGFYYPLKPHHLPRLNLVEERLISPRVPFRYGCHLTRLRRQQGVKEQCINVSVRILLRDVLIKPLKIRLHKHKATFFKTKRKPEIFD
ncbi:hypothetical protein HPB51_013221 [Rhipicephalus microplus]|uniref:DUF6570 domain-containing protein n=1 Tax=Rhipicephalus microplus TaxID=6941 RepID=A0A9J6DMM0_RHIMP|nr:hypothetical protein HPB51_013221 [Rhipicephalus microplus]